MMPDGIWEWLEIEPTQDAREIKRAYARAAKKYHPEDAPEAFRSLREAYEAALCVARGEWSGQTSFAPPDSPLRFEEHPAPAEESYAFDELIETELAEREAAVHALHASVLGRLEALYESPPTRTSVPAWRRVIKSEEFGALQDLPAFMRSLAQFLRQHPDLPVEVVMEFFFAYGFWRLEHVKDRGEYEVLYESMECARLSYVEKNKAVERRRHFRAALIGILFLPVLCVLIWLGINPVGETVFSWGGLIGAAMLAVRLARRWAANRREKSGRL